jgi:hypothetical protein
VGYVFALIPIALGLFLWWLGIRGVLLARKQGNWAQTQGVIRTSSVKTHDVPILGQVHTAGWSGSGAPRVTYEYSVDGRSYTGSNVGVPPARTRLRFGQRRNDAMDWNLSLYQEGSTLPVHYDPANPADAVLHKAQGAGCGLIVVLIVGTFFILFGWVVWRVVGAMP